MSVTEPSMENPHTSTQNANILAALRAGKRVTPMDALHKFGCFRLAARIYELRLAGHRIVTFREGEKRLAVYRLLKAAQ